MPSTLTDSLIDAYIKTFVGFGNPDGRYWFVGMEQGGGTTIPEIEARITVWGDRGHRAFENLAEYCDAFDNHAWFGAGAKSQPTWRQLIRIYLAAEGLPHSRQDALDFQKAKLGLFDGGVCLAELSSLPIRRTADWPYAAFDGLPYLASREKYQRTVAPARVSLLRGLIERHEPGVVVCYGSSYQRWNGLAGCAFESTPIRSVYLAQTGTSVVLVIPHPVAHGLSNEYFAEIGRFIRARGKCD